MITRFIGDVHGCKNAFSELLAETPEYIEQVVQIGDMGIGFGQSNYWLDSLDDAMSRYNCRFIRGNHDKPLLARTLKNYIKDGTVQNNCIFIGGAHSINYLDLIIDQNWWPDEELSFHDMDIISSVYSLIKPDVLVTHDCPHSAAKTIFKDIKNGFGGIYPTRTSEFFDRLLKIHKPKLWVFGHWHVDKDEKIDTTRFICVSSLNYIDINTTTFEVLTK